MLAHFLPLRAYARRKSLGNHGAMNQSDSTSLPHATTLSTVGAGLFDGPGEVRALCRRLDWSRTALGPPGAWPDAVRTVVRAALDSPFPINLWCGEDLTLIYNDAYREVLGSKHPLALGRAGPEVWAEIWPQIAPMFDRIRAGGDPAYAADAPFRVQRAGEPLLPAEPNAWFTFSLSGVRDDEGGIVGFLNVVSETTRRIEAERAEVRARAVAEQAEARLREVFAHAPAFLAVLRGTDHVFEYVNEAYCTLVGHDDLVGRRAFDVLPEMRVQGFDLLLDRVLATGEPFIARELPVNFIRSAEQPPEERYIDLVYYPINEADGTRSGVVAHGSDVTGHVRARRDALRARAEAEAANQTKSHFLAGMSHELRTPINAVMGYADLLDLGLAGELNPQQHLFIERIRTANAHLLGLVNDILDFSKIEAGELSVGLGVARVSQVTSQAVEIAAPQAVNGDVHIENECRASTLSLLGDEDRARQIVLNLVSNAVKFTPPAGRVRITCAEATQADGQPPPAGGPWITIDVEDTGPGIPAEQRERIFEPFVQLDQDRSRRPSGTGLGLTISRHLARLMGGDLTVHGEAGSGARFRLWLRRADPSPTPA